MDAQAAIPPLVRDVTRVRPASALLDRRFWLSHGVWPALAFALFATVAMATGFDEGFARAWAFDPVSQHFIGSGAGEWWAKNLIHGAGGRVIRIFGGVVLLVWALSFQIYALRGWRRPAGFVVLSVALSVGAVGLLKQVTNVDCPWSLADFGGLRPYVQLLADRPDFLPRAQCFPGGHSSSGFALFALYFLTLGRSRSLARWSLGVALMVGGVFAFGQEARGAHFLSHDLWSAATAWFACLAVYAFVYRRNVWA
jgi:membrane-associated PAP2 superfamily phosphatase